MLQTEPRSAALYSVAQIRAIEKAAMARLAPHTLMQRASEEAARVAQSLLARHAGKLLLRDAPVLVATGPGNNGGDAFECAAHLARRGYPVTILVPVSASNTDTDYALAQARARDCQAVFADMASLRRLGNQRWALVIDGLFGIGLTRPLIGVWRTVVDTLNAIDAPLLALDVPSGLDADTGTVAADAARPGACIRASHTLTFIGDKPGLHTNDGRDQAGAVIVATLDIDAALYPEPIAWLNRPALFEPMQHARRNNSHKGSFGDVHVVGGSAGMTGAAILASMAALKGGSGRVLIGFVDAAQVPAVIAGHPELMCRAAADLDFRTATVVAGPGLGSGNAARDLVARACETARALVLDADGLNLVSASPVLQKLLAARAGRAAPTLLTPHPLEAARLLDVPVARVQADRLRAAAALAARYRASVILKGSGTIVAHAIAHPPAEAGARAEADAGPAAPAPFAPAAFATAPTAPHVDMRAPVINPTGNPALASGGTGDVLAGLCGALLAQGWALPAAARAAVWIHGAAADRLVEAGTGPAGVTASEIVDAARDVLNDLIAGRLGRQTTAAAQPPATPATPAGPQ